MGRKRRSRCGYAVFGRASAVGAVAVLAALIGAPAGRADDDTLGNILGQADTNMAKAADALFGIATDSLSTNAISSLSGQESFDAWARTAIGSEQSLQESLSGSAQDSSELILLDKSLAVGTTQVLADDQTAAADPVSAFGNGLNLGMLLDDAKLALSVFQVAIGGFGAKLLDSLDLSDL